METDEMADEPVITPTQPDVRDGVQVVWSLDDGGDGVRERGSAGGGGAGGSSAPSRDDRGWSFPSAFHLLIVSGDRFAFAHCSPRSLDSSMAIQRNTERNGQAVNQYFDEQKKKNKKICFSDEP